MQALLHVKGLDQSKVQFKEIMNTPQTLSQDQQSKCREILLACYNNMAVCHLKSRNWERALSNANEVFNNITL